MVTGEPHEVTDESEEIAALRSKTARALKEARLKARATVSQSRVTQAAIGRELQRDPEDSRMFMLMSRPAAPPKSNGNSKAKEDEEQEEEAVPEEGTRKFHVPS